MRRLIGTVFGAFVIGLVSVSSVLAFDLGDTGSVRTYSAPDPDTTNSHIIETENGVVVISAQRLKSEATRAIARVKRIGKPVQAIIIPVPHTDHFGGLPTWLAAFPNATVYAAPATVESMRTDGEGYIASRKDAIGDDFPSQDEVNANLPDYIVGDGEEVVIDNLRFRFIDLPQNNAPTNTMVYLPDHKVLFSSEVMEDGVPAFLKDATLENWLSQLERIEQEFADTQIVFPAHGNSGSLARLIAETRMQLTIYKEGVDAALSDDGVVDDAEVASLTAQIEATFPDHIQVARVPRADLVAANIRWQAERRSGNN